ncbi:MAG: c-type cytochrome [Gammaproteobacteria bacterium]|nr:c-type cytochrome [Gammaproteobacteria bacterium]
MRNTTLWAAAMLLATTSLPAGAADATKPDISRASMTAHSCAGCHGVDGSSVGPSIPSIAAMEEDRFIDAMLDYRRGIRHSTIMTRIAKGYSDAEIRGMARFFADQELVRRSQKHDPIEAKLGARIHMESCNQCHQRGGQSPGRGGYLAGQWMPYLAFTLEDYLSGQRPVRKKMMRKLHSVIAEYGEDGVEALIHFYGSQN